MLVFQCSVQRTIETRDSRAKKDRQLQELATYSQHVEMLYGGDSCLSSWLPEYFNQSQLSIEHEDLNAIREVYENVLRESGQQFYDSKFDIAKLSHIENPAVKKCSVRKIVGSSK